MVGYKMMNRMDMTSCIMCPRNCGADRLSGKKGFCRESAALRIARAALYPWEEPCISGRNGSGAVFFTGCSLACIFCQNGEISRAENDGQEISPERLAEIFLELQEQKAENINLVTPSHQLHNIIPALKRAKDQGLTIPVVYNTGTYEYADTIRSLEGLVDIYLPDLKYFSSALSERYSFAPDYFSRASGAIAEMVRQCPHPLFSNGASSLEIENEEENPIMLRGVMVRHLVLPGSVEDSKQILRYLYETYHNDIFISIMNQYTPMKNMKKEPALARPLSVSEYDEVVDYALSLGIENGFLQEEGTVSRQYIPAFDGTGL